MMSFRGKNDLSLRVVSAYQPRATDDLYTIYQQKLQYYNDDSKDSNINDPLTKYDTDLSKLVTTWMDKHDQIIVMIDSNVDLATNKKDTFRHMLESLGLNELLLSKNLNIEPPDTRYPGKLTIDGIFGTPVLEVVRGVYFKMTEISDHRLVLVDIKWESVLGTYQMIQ